ncbi:MAG: cysteine rich repeat-containing protein [Methyloceanibacter sp.]
MKYQYLMTLIVALLVPTAALAKGEREDDVQKFCKDVAGEKGAVGACLQQHERQLGGGFAPQGIHVQKYRWHRQIRRG